MTEKQRLYLDMREAGRSFGGDHLHGWKDSGQMLPAAKKSEEAPALG